MQDLVITIVRATGDVQAAELIAGIMEHLGRDGVIRIERSGKGYPYEVDLPEPVEKRRGRKARRHLRELVAQRDATTSEADWRRIHSHIAELCGGIAIVRVNVDSDALFQEKKRSLEKGVQIARRLADGKLFVE